MIFQQFYLNCLAHASYLVGDEKTGVAAVVDPQRDIDQYLDAADRHGLRIAHVILTHFHADFVAGHLELRERTGAAIYLGAAATAEYAFHPLHDGDTIEMGRVRLTAIKTPGHTIESISILVHDLDRDAVNPYAVLTGDALFVGDVGRPDLRVALGWSATTLGGMLYESVHDKLLKLPDSSLVYPAHGAGSLCGKAIGRETFSTIGQERRTNYALQPMSKDAFVGLVSADQPEAPPYFTYDAVLNTRERATLAETLDRQLIPLSLDELLAAQAKGAQVLDTRAPDLFAAAHLAGSINIGLVGHFATWAGTVLDHEAPIVIVADPGSESESAMRLGRIGFDRVAGYLKGGLEAARARADLIQSTERIGADVAAARVESAEPPFVIDVRSEAEHAERPAIPSGVNIPLGSLESRLGEVPRDRPLLVFCAGGYRSSIAASLLQKHGFTKISELAGGAAAWPAARSSVGSV